MKLAIVAVFLLFVSANAIDYLDNDDDVHSHSVHHLNAKLTNEEENNANKEPSTDQESKNLRARRETPEEPAPGAVPANVEPSDEVDEEGELQEKLRLSRMIFENKNVRIIRKIPEKPTEDSVPAKDEPNDTNNSELKKEDAKKESEEKLRVSRMIFENAKVRMMRKAPEEEPAGATALVREMPNCTNGSSLKKDDEKNKQGNLRASRMILENGKARVIREGVEEPAAPLVSANEDSNDTNNGTLSKEDEKKEQENLRASRMTFENGNVRVIRDMPEEPADDAPSAKDEPASPVEEEPSDNNSTLKKGDEKKEKHANLRASRTIFDDETLLRALKKSRKGGKKTRKPRKEASEGSAANVPNNEEKAGESIGAVNEEKKEEPPKVVRQSEGNVEKTETQNDEHSSDHGSKRK